MARKYQKFGFRRDKNLSDATSKTQVLDNILNNLPSVDGETYDSSDLYAVKGLKNTNIDNDVLKSFAGITDVYTSPDDILKPITPLITLKDRIDNYKVYTGDPLYGNGGDGLTATFIPSNLISTSITSSTTGASGSIYTSETTYGPYRFWDNGRFEFNNKIYEEFQDSYGMVQWNGYYGRRILRPETNYIKFQTSGYILIEENLTDTTNGWSTVKSIYSDNISITVTGTGVSSNTLDVGTTNIKYIAIGQSITQYPNVKVTDIVGTTVTLSSAITVPDSPTDLNFTFSLGYDLIYFYVRFSDTIENDKLKIRFTLWWPKPPGLSPIIYDQKVLYCDHESFEDGVAFPFFYQTYARDYLNQSVDTIGYFVENKLSPLKGTTNSDLISSKNILVKYEPPLVFSDRISYNTVATVTSGDLGKLTSTGNVFQDAVVGDIVLIRNASPTVLAYKIKEKRNNNNVYLNTLEKFAYSPQITLAKYNGLVGIFNITGGVISSLGGEKFDHRLISPDHVITPLTTEMNASSPFYRVKSYNKTSKAIVVTNLAGDTVATISGIVLIYQDKGVEDRSKEVFCNGVFGKLTSGNVVYDENQPTYDIPLKDVDGISVNHYAQFTGYIPSSSKIKYVNTTTKTITLFKPILKSILANSTIVISPKSDNREMCVIPLDTAYPFVGTESGLETQSQNLWLSAKDIEFDRLNIIYDPLNTKISTQNYVANLPYTKTLIIKQNGVSYKLVIV